MLRSKFIAALPDMAHLTLHGAPEKLTKKKKLGYGKMEGPNCDYIQKKLTENTIAEKKQIQ